MDEFFLFEMNKEQVEKIKSALKADKDEYDMFIKSNTQDFVRASKLKDFLCDRELASHWRAEDKSAGEVERMYYEGRRSAFELVYRWLK